MIVSHRHKFIFFRTTKTAGTSIEIALSRFCGDEDIITPVRPKDEELRIELGGRGPGNFTVPFSEYSIRDWAYVLRRRRRRAFYNHMPAKKVRRLLGEEVWSDYFKFCFVRNPWDRVISWYYWRNRVEPRPTISKFISSGALKRLNTEGYGIYTIRGEVAMDGVYRYENLQYEFESVCRKHLRINGDLTLPRAKAGHRDDQRHYRELLTDEDQIRIAKTFREEISLFGYEF